MKYALSALAGAAALAISLIVGPAMAQDGGIVVYNAQHESLTDAWVEGFTKETGIKVTVRHGGDSDFSNQIVAEGAASPADVFLTENSPAMVLVESAGLFAPVDAETLAQVPQEYQPSSGKWVGIAARSTVFVYNKTKLTAEQLPKSLLDLADPSWKGRWAASQAIVSAVLQLKGEAATAGWLKAMKENFTAYKGNSTVMKAVNAGEVEGGVIYHYYYYGDQAKTGENSKNIGLHYFKNQDPGAFVSVSGGGVLASSKHPKEAQAFLKWVTGKGGQDVLKTGNSFEYAVGKDADSNP
ncbi:MAG: iron ABC transporter substrate-binding protein, partial [Mesorhizobium sp.]